MYYAFLEQRSPTFLAPGTSFVKDNFAKSGKVKGKVSGWFMHITFIVHFISIIIMPIPPQIVSH